MSGHIGDKHFARFDNDSPVWTKSNVFELVKADLKNVFISKIYLPYRGHNTVNWKKLQREKESELKISEIINK